MLYEVCINIKYFSGGFTEGDMELTMSAPLKKDGVDASKAGDNYTLEIRIESQKKNRGEYSEDNGGTMGRWEYKSTTLAKDGALTLHNATRIPRKDGVVEVEFLIDEENAPRDIVLQTRGLNNAEKNKIKGIKKN